MYKLVDSASFFKEDSNVTIIDLGSTSKGLEKKAADDRISEYASNLKPKPGKCYLHINAMGAGEYYGANRNCDYFPEEQLIKYHKTFETSPAHLFRHHINKDPKKANGVVIFSIYNERMHRVELIVEADLELVQDIENRISQGDFPATSMACRTPYDVCSICGNEAHSREEYCVHLTRELGKVYPDGRKAMSLNLGPLKFFDISIVIKPADVTSSVLQKIAGEGEAISSTEAAEAEGLSDLFKSAELKKLSELIKEISDASVVNVSTDPSKLLDLTSDIPYEAVDWLKEYKLSQVLKAMADMGISPSVGFLAELVARRSLGEGWAGIGPIASEYLKEAPTESLVKSISFEEEEDSEVPMDLYAGLNRYSDQSSLLPQYVEKRAGITGYRNDGYKISPKSGVDDEALDLLSTSPWREPVPDESKENVKHSYSKLLLGLAVAAILAKQFINKRIEKASLSKQTGAKIGVIKQASSISDYAVASYLSKVAMQQHIAGKQRIIPRVESPDFWINRGVKRVVGKLKLGPELLAAMKLKRAADKLSAN